MRTLDHVISELDRVIQWATHASSRIGFFAAVYRSVTVEIRRMAQAGEFDDVASVVRLGVDFAQRYFDAVDAFRANRRPSRCWQVAFSATQDDRLLIVQHLVLGMNAHINFDLALAVAEVSSSLGQLAQLRGDFERLAGIFARLIEDVESRIGTASPSFGDLDGLAGNSDERLVGFSIAAARAHAWSNARALVAAGPVLGRVLADAQDELVAGFGQTLRNPLLTAALAPIRRDESNDVPRIIEQLTAGQLAPGGSGAWRSKIMTKVETSPPRPGNAVFLIPGLLGFESFANFSYFTDRVAAALRAGLERALDEPVPIIAVPIPPTASLQERQAQLLKTLSSRVFELSVNGCLPNIHLVGHSTGGVDANLLTCERPVGNGCWADVAPDAPAILAAIRSVVTLGSPHQGACITRDPIAEFIRSHGWRGKAAAAGVLFEIAQGALADPDARELVTGAAFDLGSVWRFLRATLLGGELIDDLQPDRGRGPGAFRQDVVRKTFVTIASCPRPGLAGVGRPNALFRDLTVRASGKISGCSEEGSNVVASLARLREALTDPAGPPIIGNPGTVLPLHLDAGHNDGIVNSVRQLFDPADPDELAAIVIGDHFDVVGHYDRRVWRLDRHGDEQAVLINSGLLHSGSAFRDEEFFKLYRLIADSIADAARITKSARLPELHGETGAEASPQTPAYDQVALPPRVQATGAE